MKIFQYLYPYDDDQKNIIDLNLLDPLTLIVAAEPGTGTVVWIQNPDIPQLRRVLLDANIIYISYSNNFNVNLQQAREAGVRTAVLTFTVEGVNPEMLTTQNQISINGINLGVLNNGTNIFEVPLSSLIEGSNNVTLTSGSSNIFIPTFGFGGGRSFTDYDDFEFSDLNITWQR